MKPKKITELSGNSNLYTLWYGPYYISDEAGGKKMVECIQVIYLDGVIDALHVDISHPTFCQYLSDLKDDARYVTHDQFKPLRADYIVRQKEIKEETNAAH